MTGSGEGRDHTRREYVMSNFDTDIKSFEARLESRKEDAIKAIEEGCWLAAQNAMNDCIGFEAVINELRFQSERMEVEQW